MFPATMQHYLPIKSDAMHSTDWTLGIAGCIMGALALIIAIGNLVERIRSKRMRKSTDK